MRSRAACSRLIDTRMRPIAANVNYTKVQQPLQARLLANCYHVLLGDIASPKFQTSPASRGDSSVGPGVRSTGVEVDAAQCDPAAGVSSFGNLPGGTFAMSVCRTSSRSADNERVERPIRHALPPGGRS